LNTARTLAVPHARVVASPSAGMANYYSFQQGQGGQHAPPPPAAAVVGPPPQPNTLNYYAYASPPMQSMGAPVMGQAQPMQQQQPRAAFAPPSQPSYYAPTQQANAAYAVPSAYPSHTGMAPYGAAPHAMYGPLHSSPPHSSHPPQPLMQPQPQPSQPFLLSPEQQMAQQAARRQQQQQRQQIHAGSALPLQQQHLSVPPPSHSPLVLSTSAPSLSSLALGVPSSQSSAAPTFYGSGPAPSTAPPPASPLSASESLSSSSPPPSLPAVFHDLDSRFLVNLPDEELSSFERILFQLQQAHWYYLDFYSDRHPTLPALGFKRFCELYFKHIPTFRKHLARFDQVYASFNSYLNAVPVCGCILVAPDMQHVLMVQSWQGQSWGFPRGKLDQHEDEITCAIREVEEEVGFDARAWFKGYDIKPVTPAGSASLSRQTSTGSNASCSSSVLASQQPSFLEAYTSNKATRLYVLLNVPRDTKFATRTRKEISQIEWIPLSALPGGGGNNARNNNPGGKSAPPLPEPTGNPAVDAANLSAYHAAQASAGGAAAPSALGRLKFGTNVATFAGKLRTFLKKVKSGQITGYGIYEPPREANNQQQQQAPPPQQQGKKQPQQQQAQQKPESKSARKAANTQQSGGSGARRGSASSSAKSLSFAADGNNGDTFGASTSGSTGGLGGGGGGGSGWSVEQMFAANARLGVVSTVQEEKLQLSPQLDAQLDKFLGRKPQNGQQAQQQQQQQQAAAAPKGKKKQKASGAGAAAAITDASLPYSGGASAPMAIPAPSKAHAAAAYTAKEELDFGHDPHQAHARLTSFANMDVQQQQRQQAQASAPAAAPAPASAQKPGKKSRGGSANKKFTAADAGADGASPPQYRILPRGVTASAPSGLPVLPSSAPAAAAPVSAAAALAPAAAAPAAFKFDMSSITAALH